MKANATRNLFSTEEILLHTNKELGGPLEILMGNNACCPKKRGLITSSRRYDSSLNANNLLAWQHNSRRWSGIEVANRNYTARYNPPSQQKIQRYSESQRKQGEARHKILLEQERREEEENQRKLAEIKERSRLRNSAILQQIKQQNLEDRRRIQQPFDENAKFESMRMKPKFEIDESGNEARFSFNEFKLETENDESRRIDQRIRNNEIRYEQEQRDRDMIIQQAKQKHYAKRQKIDYDFERQRQKLHEDAEIRKQEMYKQFEAIQKIMLNSVWNDAIERNWTNRLNYLRSANRDSEKWQIRCLTKNPSKWDMEQWDEAIQILQEKMNDESSNMVEMHYNTNKDFLIDIKRAVDNVSSACSVLLMELRGARNMGRLAQLSTAVNKCCIAIPTLSELKRNYYSEMRNSSYL